MSGRSLATKGGAFAIVRDGIDRVEATIRSGLGWPVGPSVERRYVEDLQIDLQKGGGRPGEGAFYYSMANERSLIFLSDGYDGWQSLLHCLSVENGTSYLAFRLFAGKQSLAEMCLVEAGKVVRLIRAMKDGRWTFHEVGDPLPFEEVGSYSKRVIADRVSHDLLLSYSRKNGIDFASPLFFRTDKKSLWVNEGW